MSEEYNYFQGKEFRASLAAYEHMLATGETTELDSETLTDIAEYYAMNMQDEEANRCIRYALSFYPDSVDPQIFLARQQMFYGNQEEAWRICNAIADQEDHEVVFLRAELFLHFQKSEEAFRLLLAYYRETDREEAPEHLYDSIVLCKDYGFGEKALEWVKILRNDFPDYLPAIALQAEIHNYRHEYQDAISLLEANIERMPYDSRAWLQLAEAHLWLEQHDEAIEAVDFALAINSEDAEGLIMRANILCDSSRMDEAHEYYVRFLHYFPNDERANFLDAQCLISMEQYRTAIGRLERLVSMPGCVAKGDYLSFLAYCHNELGHEEQSLHYRKQAEKEPSNALHHLFPEFYPDTENKDDLPDNPFLWNEDPDNPTIPF